MTRVYSGILNAASDGAPASMMSCGHLVVSKQFSSRQIKASSLSVSRSHIGSSPSIPASFTKYSTMYLLLEPASTMASNLRIGRRRGRKGRGDHRAFNLTLWRAFSELCFSSRKNGGTEPCFLGVIRTAGFGQTFAAFSIDHVHSPREATSTTLEVLMDVLYTFTNSNPYFY